MPAGIYFDGEWLKNLRSRAGDLAKLRLLLPENVHGVLELRVGRRYCRLLLVPLADLQRRISSKYKVKV